jgi:hypothetical protein
VGDHQKRTFLHLPGIIFWVWRLGMMGTVDFSLCYWGVGEGGEAGFLLLLLMIWSHTGAPPIKRQHDFLMFIKGALKTFLQISKWSSWQQQLEVWLPIRDYTERNWLDTAAAGGGGGGGGPAAKESIFLKKQTHLWQWWRLSLGFFARTQLGAKNLQQVLLILKIFAFCVFFTTWKYVNNCSSSRGT